MKRFICAVLILVMLIPTAFAAEPANAVDLKITASGVPQVGEELVFTVKSVNAPACSSFRIFITYDGDMLACTGTKQLDAEGLMGFNTETPYEGMPKVGVAAAHAQLCFQGNTDLYSISFKVLALPTDGAPLLNVAFTEFFDTAEHAQPIAPGNVQIDSFVKVPSLVGKTKAEAEAALAEKGLTLTANVKPFELGQQPGRVLTQEIAADTLVAAGTAVSVTVSGEPEVVQIPDLAGKTKAEAEMLLAGLKLKVDYVPDEPYQLDTIPGIVLYQNLTAGVSATQGTTVTLTLRGQPQEVPVPNLLGKTKAEAEALLASNLFKGAFQTGAYDANYAENAVIAQSASGNLLQGSTVTVTMNGPKPAPQPVVNPFKDVKSTQYYYDAVLWAVEKNITTGVSETKFAPNDACTRGQIVTFLWRAAGCPEPTGSTNPFTDVKAKDYYYKAVLWAVENGITTGMSATKFAPNAKCTREQIVTFLWRAADQPAPTSTVNPFTDVKAGAYYYDAVLWAVENEITTGMTKTTFGPKSECTRGQIVTFLFRAEQ